MQWLIFIAIQAGIILLAIFISKRKQKNIAKPTKRVLDAESTNEMLELKAMRQHTLSVPLSEKARPNCLNDIIGQKDSIEALLAAICGSNPQHVLIYGPPGVGKTCAARLVLEEAKKRDISPFGNHSKFIEVDATCVRFDERSIADPLLGSVHDPIYQGAGSLGVAGIPQPKPGAVTRAHCGVLFLDEIGELHPIQMNKLLKVLEDRCVHFESSYYSKSNRNIPQYIHDVFQNGLPADFRLIGATTRRPEEISPALRSRCVEIFFQPLTSESIMSIAENAVKRTNGKISPDALSACAAYSSSGRDAVNIIQLAGSRASNDNRITIDKKDIEWVASVCHYTKNFEFRIPNKVNVGISFGLGVNGNVGSVIEIECTAIKSLQNIGSLKIHGAVTEEEFSLSGGHNLRRKSMISASVENVLDAINRIFKIDCRLYDISFNIPGGIPLDGPSAGAALAVALMSALTGKPPKKQIAFTGEVTANGEIRAVGGIPEKLNAAKKAGALSVVIPKDNKENAAGIDIAVHCVDTVSEVFALAFESKPSKTGNSSESFSGIA